VKTPVLLLTACFYGSINVANIEILAILLATKHLSSVGNRLIRNKPSSNIQRELFLLAKIEQVI
jgi:hypothetical protein